MYTCDASCRNICLYLFSWRLNACLGRRALSQLYFRTNLRDTKYQFHSMNNIKLVFRISEDGSEIELKHCASSKTSVKSSRKYFVHLNWIRLATNPVHSIAQWVERRSRYPKMRIQIPLEPTNFSLVYCSVNNMRLIFRISEDGSEIEYQTIDLCFAFAMVIKYVLNNTCPIRRCIQKVF